MQASHDVRTVGFHRLDANIERSRNVLAAFSLRQQANDLALTTRQPVAPCADRVFPIFTDRKMYNRRRRNGIVSMFKPGNPVSPGMSTEDSFFELLAETLENVDRTVRAQFLQRFFKTLAQLELDDAAGLELWDRILRERRELADSLEKPVPLRTAIIKVMASLDHLRVPVLMEYDKLKKLQIDAVTDSLTGLYNRRLFDDHFERELSRARRHDQRLAIVMLDLRQFKEINDRHGHARGDLILCALAMVLRKSLRTSDYAFRVGGDEFALLLLQSDMDRAATLAHRVRANFTAAIEALQMSATVNLDYGLAIYPEDGAQGEVLLRLVEERLSGMKRGRSPDDAAIPSYLPKTRHPVTPVAGIVESPKSPAGRDAPHSPASERRKWERVHLAGTRAYAHLEDRSQTARLIDLSYGGVALEFSTPVDLGLTFEAVLHVPILPPVRVSLKPLYRTQTSSGNRRVGCVFIEDTVTKTDATTDLKP